MAKTRTSSSCWKVHKTSKFCCWDSCDRMLALSHAAIGLMPPHLKRCEDGVKFNYFVMCRRPSYMVQGDILKWFLQTFCIRSYHQNDSASPSGFLLPYWEISPLNNGLARPTWPTCIMTCQNNLLGTESMPPHVAGSETGGEKLYCKAAPPVDGNQKSGINSPVEVGSWNPILCRILAPSQVVTLAGFLNHQ